MIRCSAEIDNQDNYDTLMKQIQSVIDADSTKNKICKRLPVYSTESSFAAMKRFCLKICQLLSYFYLFFSLQNSCLQRFNNLSFLAINHFISFSYWNSYRRFFQKFCINKYSAFSDSLVFMEISFGANSTGAIMPASFVSDLP